jgi:signal recognition particle GTPase
VTGDAPASLPQERPLGDPAIGSETSGTGRAATSGSARVDAEAAQPGVAQQPPVPSRSSFSTSILGLDRSLEELQAAEAALERTFENRFKTAIAATRESLSEKIDTVFQGRKKIDAELLDELEEALIAADIGVPTTLEILETVRRGITRKEINDIEALKAAIKNQLLAILRSSAEKGVAAETLVPENVSPYVLMIVGVNGVGKTTTIGRHLSRRRLRSTRYLGRTHGRPAHSAETGNRPGSRPLRFAQSGEGAQFRRAYRGHRRTPPQQI